MTTFRGNQFQREQRAYNGLFSFTALGAGGIDKKSWTQPQKVQTMLNLHGKSYHKIFDLRQQYRHERFEQQQILYFRQ